MTGGREGLLAHLATGSTTICRAWAVRRRDGLALGFTDHDVGFEFEGIRFRADTGLTARALQQGTGLAVDNTQAMGALSDAAIREADIAAGRYDGAEVRCWQVNWQDVAQREMLFRGTLGEIRRVGGVFEAELRGLAEVLNQVQGRVYHRSCAAVLGDGACRFDLEQPGFAVERAVEVVEERQIFRFAGASGQAAGWFDRGRLVVQSGDAAGLMGLIKRDRLLADGGREIELWESLRADLAPGDMLRLEAGCDKRAETCAAKFGNFLNFRGFPHIPGDDWLASFPSSATANDGGRLRG